MLRWYARISVADASVGTALCNVPVSMRSLGVGGCEECFWEIINTQLLTYKSLKPDTMRPLILLYLDTKHYSFAPSVRRTFFCYILNVVYELADYFGKKRRSFISCCLIGWRLSKLFPDWLAFLAGARPEICFISLFFQFSFILPCGWNELRKLCWLQYLGNRSFWLPLSEAYSFFLFLLFKMKPVFTLLLLFSEV